MNSPPQEQAKQADELPSQTVRTVVSFLLFVHLFALAVAVFSSAPASGLMRKMRTVPFVMSYLEALYLDSGYRYALTLGSEMDMAHFVELDLQRDGEVVKQIVLPEDNVRPRLRHRRQHTLVFVTQRLGRLAQLDEDDAQVAGDRETLLPRAIADGLMRQHGYDQARLRIRGRALQRIEDVGSSHPVWGNPLHEDQFETVMAADVAIDAQGNTTFVKQELQDRRTAPAPEE